MNPADQKRCVVLGGCGFLGSVISRHLVSHGWQVRVFDQAGISTWRLELPQAVRQFNYQTISDVILHLKYTARDAGSSLRTLAEATLKDQLDGMQQQLSQTGLHVDLNLAHHLPNAWHVLQQTGKVDITIDQSRLPYMAQTMDAVVGNVIASACMMRCW